ncbi:Hypothetical predicted protein, partial [Podarcis lilfordi]
RACVLCLVGLSPPPCICSLLWRFPQPTEADLGVAEGLQRGRDEGKLHCVCLRISPTDLGPWESQIPGQAILMVAEWVAIQLYLPILPLLKIEYAIRRPILF